MLNLIFGDKPREVIDKLANLIRESNNLNPEVTKFLAQNKNSLNTQELSQTLLYIAHLGKKSEAIKPLIESNADPNYKGTFDNTPLHIATANGYAKTCLTLLKFNANPHSSNTLNYNPTEAALSWFKQYPKQPIPQNKLKSILLCIKLNNTAQTLDLNTPKSQLTLDGFAEQEIKMIGEEADS